MQQKQRPLGVTIIAILMIISGIALISTGAVLLVVGIGVVPIALGIASFVVAYGLWEGKRWAWTITLIISVISIISAIVSLAYGGYGAIINIIINAIIIYYLYRPNVKAFFGKVQSPATK
jgi:uncharacterized membrane protein (DUF2068 family)